MSSSAQATGSKFPTITPNKPAYVAMVAATSRLPLVGGPAEGGAQIGQFGGEPVVRPPLPWAVPQRKDVCFASGKVAGMRRPNLFRRPGGGELFLGELADRLQHREPGPPGGPVGDQQRLAHQRVQQIEDGVVVDVIESGHRAGAFEVESAGEHRTPLQQLLLRVIEVVVGPRHRVAQRLVACQATPGPDQQAESTIETIPHLAGGHRCHA